MLPKKKGFFVALLLSICLAVFLFVSTKSKEEVQIISVTINTQTQDLQLYWKDDSGKNLKSIQNLKAFVESKKRKLDFAMNGGMYLKDRSSVGLFIQDFKKQKDLDTGKGFGNFYLKPNGVFYLDRNRVPSICRTEDFKDSGQVQYATQSGPMLLVNGKIHPAFIQGSSNLNIRNGVGILPDKRLVFAISKKEINFYDFAKYFQSLGCENALYLDGFVSRAYMPEQNLKQLDGEFGVMVGVSSEATK